MRIPLRPDASALLSVARAALCAVTDDKPLGALLEVLEAGAEVEAQWARHRTQLQAGSISMMNCSMQRSHAPLA